MSGDLISKLKGGLYLEDKDTLIPWLTPIDNLVNFSEPEIIAEAKKPSGLIHKTPYQYFIWKDHIWAGLHCNIQTQLYYEAKSPKVWDQSNLFQYCYINMLDKNLQPNVQAEYDYLVSHFNNLYGHATKTGYHKDLYRNYPYHYWEFDKVRISVVMQERFLEFNTIMVKYQDD
jgi:hypothetical protein